MQEPVTERLSKQVIIRRFQPQDQDAVFNIYCRTLDKLGLLRPERSNPKNFEDIQKTYLEGRNGDFFVGELDGQIVATGGYNPDEEHQDIAFIRRMYTLPDQQGQGIGEKILKQLEESINGKLQYKKMQLFTTNEMVNAQKLYKKMGFAVAEKQTDGFIYEKIIERPSTHSDL